MKNKSKKSDVVIQQLDFMPMDAWCQCCCIIAPYAAQLNMTNFCNLNLGDSELDDLRNNIVYTASINGQTVGFLIGALNMQGPKPYAEIDWFFLDADVQSQGIGSKMLDKFEKYVQKRHNAFGAGIKYLKSARKFYEKHGYRVSTEDSRFMNKYFDKDR